MDYFVWDERYAIGQAEIDQQHRHLIGLLNSLGVLVTSPNPLAADVATLNQELVSYANYHFGEEEALMRRCGVDTRHFAHHEAAHRQFADHLPRLQEMVNPQDATTAMPLLGFLTNWLVYHILTIDYSMGRQVSAIAQGQSAEEAYRPEQHQFDHVIGSLVASVNSLFRQVSARNRELQELNRTLEQKVEQRTTALLDANAEMTRMLHRLEAEMESSRRLSDELARANLDLTRIAQTDALTGLANRRHALQLLDNLWRKDKQLACILIDADGFKQINDCYGHDAGDEVLRKLAHRLRDSVRTDDLVCRLGGDEFLIICPATPMNGAVHVAEKVRGDVAGMRVAVGSGEWIGSISVGVASRDPLFTQYEELLKSADKALYAAKRKGRNRVEMV